MTSQLCVYFFHFVQRTHGKMEHLNKINFYKLAISVCCMVRVCIHMTEWLIYRLFIDSVSTIKVV
jgi:hypothetical protein